MVHYRIYRLNDADCIVAGTDHECDGDDAACALAGRLLGAGTHGEVWQRARLVRRVVGAGPATCPSS